MSLWYIYGHHNVKFGSFFSFLIISNSNFSLRIQISFIIDGELITPLHIRLFNISYVRHFSADNTILIAFKSDSKCY